MLNQTTIRSVLLFCLGLGLCQPASAQVLPDIPYETIDQGIRTVALQSADLIETAGYSESAHAIRQACKDTSSSSVNCAIYLAAYGGTILILREHEIVGTFYRTIGQDDIARDYANCEEEPGLIGDSTDLGSMHCSEQLATDPLWAGSRAAVLNLADIAEAAGYSSAARDMREDCQYPGPVGACALAPQHLILGIATGSAAGESTGDTTPVCQSTGLITHCPTLRPIDVTSLADLGFGGLDQTGDGMFSVADLSLLSGSRLSLDGLLGGLLTGSAQPEEGRAVWLALEAITLGPAVASGTPLADDYYGFLQALAAMSAEPAALRTSRRAARLTP